MRYKLTIAYDGTNYAGWQIQPNAIAIQEVLQEKASKILQEECIIVGAGRTDAGVHADAQVAHFDTEKILDPGTFLLSFNSLLPKDIRITSVEKVPDTFHSRFSAKQKTYTYTIDRSEILDPLHRFYRTHIRSPLDLPLMKMAAARMTGTHDFTTFANVGSVKGGIRTIHSIKIEESGPLLTLTFTGTGFLYKMVRNLTGTLLHIACKKLTLEGLDHLFTSLDRRNAPPPAPPQGLTLTTIDY